jgi:hypothetical protein
MDLVELPGSALSKARKYQSHNLVDRKTPFMMKFMQAGYMSAPTGPLAFLFTSPQCWCLLTDGAAML